MNGLVISEQLVRSKTYAAEQALWVEAWITRQRIPWGGHTLAVICTLVGAVFGAVLTKAMGQRLRSNRISALQAA